MEEKDWLVTYRHPKTHDTYVASVTGKDWEEAFDNANNDPYYCVQKVEPYYPEKEECYELQ